MPKSGKVLIFIALINRQISITTTSSRLSQVPRGFMAIIQFIMGVIMGIYLMEVLDGQWATKKVLTFSKTDLYPDGRKEDHHKKYSGDSRRI